MKPSKSKLKKMLCREHREYVYGQALDNLIAGTETPEYCRYRWQKLKQVKEGR
jgi:hypothetical protein